MSILLINTRVHFVQFTSVDNSTKQELFQNKSKHEQTRALRRHSQIPKHTEELTNCRFRVNRGLFANQSSNLRHKWAVCMYLRCPKLEWHCHKQCMSMSVCVCVCCVWQQVPCAHKSELERYSRIERERGRECWSEMETKQYTGPSR